ncbi:MAG TPA: class I SAM-dependent methyltransferase [Allosphingosinicella sp.]|nr:class I SAM-dependent methyltransferase [Allosphingosinicella sp.]
MAGADLLPAGRAFDAIAGSFDSRFEPWLSVAAQRRAVRGALAAVFPAGSQLLEIGGGTGLDAAWLAARGRSVLLTDASPAMVREAQRKLGAGTAEVMAAEQLGRLAARGERFDGAYSNFAALNCVADLEPVARDLAALVRPGGKVMLVLFGCFCPGEMVVETLRGRFANVLRRLRRGDVTASLSGRSFSVRYHRRRAVRHAFAPWFRPAGTKAIGLFVPPSAAEPWISRHPHLLGALETADKLAARALAPLGDHVLHIFQRTDAP